MDIEDLVKDASSLNSYQFDQRLGRLVRENYKYRNLDSKNKELVLGLVKKYKDYIRRGRGIPYSARIREMYKLNRNRIKLGLTQEDLRDIRKILKAFK